MPYMLSQLPRSPYTSTCSKIQYHEYNQTAHKQKQAIRLFQTITFLSFFFLFFCPALSNNIFGEKRHYEFMLMLKLFCYWTRYLHLIYMMSNFLSNMTICVPLNDQH